MGDVVKFLKQTKIEDLFKDDKAELVVAKTTDPASQTLKKLLKAKVLSIPLYDEQKKEYTAFFDFIDVLHFVTSVRPSLLPLLPQIDVRAPKMISLN